MAYRYSELDKDNRNWMKSDRRYGTLSSISLSAGQLRGLRPFKIEFTYPISAIAGENGTGKSTLLALAACAFHNSSDGFKLSARRTPYYTFSEFFVQSNEEVPPSGITIECQILKDKRRGKDVSREPQIQTKGERGRWSDYKRRVNRNVVYFGIQRVVPHYERASHKSYRRYFQVGALEEHVRDHIRQIAGRILARDYSDFELHEHSKYSLPVAAWSGLRYSGFNMGAGESVVFEIFATLFASGPGTLLVIDEIELGLHEKAQKRLIEELKILCKELHCQVICSTHSHQILEGLPPEGRFFIEQRGDETVITPEISPEYACGKLRGSNSEELDVFVEDNVAKSILEASFSLELRKRIRIHPIGSSEAVVRQLAARYLEKNDHCVAILDGDQRDKHQQLVGKFRSNVETPRCGDIEYDMTNWCNARLNYLPGDEWPEKWLVESTQASDDLSELVDCWRLSSKFDLEDALSESLRAGKHNEFFKLSEEMQQTEEKVLSDLSSFVTRTQPENIEHIESHITEMLGIRR